jgi:excisionase family DNA binding protein
MKKSTRRTSSGQRPPSPQRGEGTLIASLPTGQIYLTKAQMAAVLQVSIRTIGSMMASGELCFLRLKGRFIRFRLEDVQRQLNETALVCNRPADKEGA